MTRNPGIQEYRNTEYGIRSTLKVPTSRLAASLPPSLSLQCWRGTCQRAHSFSVCFGLHSFADMRTHGELISKLRAIYRYLLLSAAVVHRYCSDHSSHSNIYLVYNTSIVL